MCPSPWDVEGFLMPCLGDLNQSFSHPSLVDKGTGTLHSVFMSVLFHPLINKIQDFRSWLLQGYL